MPLRQKKKEAIVKTRRVNISSFIQNAMERLIIHNTSACVVRKLEMAMSALNESKPQESHKVCKNCKPSCRGKKNNASQFNHLTRNNIFQWGLPKSFSFIQMRKLEVEDRPHYKKFIFCSISCNYRQIPTQKQTIRPCGHERLGVNCVLHRSSGLR